MARDTNARAALRVLSHPVALFLHRRAGEGTGTFAKIKG